MDAANQPPNCVEVRPVENCNRRNQEEEAAMNEALPLPAALRNDELTEQEFDAPHRNAMTRMPPRAV